MTEQYWASLPEEEIAAEILARVEEYHEFLAQCGKLGELRKSYSTYYGDTSIVTVDQSLQAMHINHYANLIRHVLVDVTAQRPALEAKAINTDMKSQAVTQLASGLQDYYTREKQIETYINEAIEKCLFLREGWVSAGWNVNGGEVYGLNPDNGLPINEGDIEVDAHTIADVIRDVRRRDMSHDWHIIRKFKNKWDLAAQRPDLAEKISGLSIDSEYELKYEIAVNQKATELDMETDLIPVYTLYHAKTPAMPQGRMITVLSDDIVLFDGPLPYKRVYLFPATSSKQLLSSFGHSNLMDLLPTQDAFNATVSAILTNQAANAVQTFQVPKGAGPNLVQLSNGMSILEFDPKAGKMEPLALLQTAPEVFQFAQFLEGEAEKIAGVSQISRGNAPPTMSGTAMALLAQQAIQFSSGVQLSRTLLLESVGTAIIELLQTFAVTPRIAEIAGKSKRYQMIQFKNSDLDGFSRFVADTANPLTKTSAGRVEIANQLLQSGLIKTPEQYISVLTTGNLEPLYEHEQSNLNLIRTENEWLMDGKSPSVVITDDDALHVLEHQCVANSPESRENPKVLQALFEHTQAHIDQAKGKDPVLAAMLKQQSFFQPPPMAMPPNQLPPVPGQGGAPQGQGPEPVMDNQNPITEQAEQTQLPKPAQAPELNPMEAM
jgi:hypothetical protein